MARLLLACVLFSGLAAQGTADERHGPPLRRMPPQDVAAKWFRLVEPGETPTQPRRLPPVEEFGRTEPNHNEGFNSQNREREDNQKNDHRAKSENNRQKKNKPEEHDDNNGENDDDDKAEELESLKDRLDELEEELSDLKDEWDEKKADEKKKPSVDLTGRMHLDYWSWGNTTEGINFIEGGAAGTDPEDRFQFRRLRLGAEGDLAEKMTFQIEIEFADPSNVELIDNYLGFTDLPLLQTVLIGLQKRPYGMDYMHSSRDIVFMERAMVIEAINPEGRRLGVVSYGYSDDLLYNWRYGVFSQRDPTLGGAAIGDQYVMQATGRLASTPIYNEFLDGRRYLHWGISGSHGVSDPNDPDDLSARFRTVPEMQTDNPWIDTGSIAGTESVQVLGVEGMLTLGAFSLFGEYLAAWVNRVDAPGLFFHGGYVGMAYFLTGEHIPWNRERGNFNRVQPFENFWLVHPHTNLRSGWGAWQLAARWSYADFSDADVLGGVGSTFTFGVNWWWNSRARMQFNYLLGSINDRFAAGDVRDGAWYGFGARVMFGF